MSEYKPPEREIFGSNFISSNTLDEENFTVTQVLNKIGNSIFHHRYETKTNRTDGKGQDKRLCEIS